MSDWIPAIRARLAAARLDPVREAEIAQELAQHLDDRYAELRRGGTPPDEARRLALDELKDHAAMREELTRVERRESTLSAAGAPGRPLQGLWQDVRFACRSLRLNPGFAALALATLALGIAATTVIYAVVDTVLLRPLPYKDAERIVRLSQVRASAPDSMYSVSYPNFADWREASQTIEAMTIVTNTAFLVIDGEPEQVEALQVTADYMRVSGVRPLLGRDFNDTDYAPGASGVALLSHGAWQRRYAGDLEVLGRAIQTTVGPVEIIGVLPPDRLYWRSELLVPMTIGALATMRHAAAFPVYGRLRAGVTLEQAQAEMDTIAAAIAKEHPEANGEIGVRLTPITELETRTLRQPLYMFLGAVVCVLLIACVNVAGLQVARSTGRAHEVAVRVALGASRWRLVRQLLTENVVLAVVGGALGVLLAWWLFAALVPLLPVWLPGEVAAIDARVVAIVLAASAGTGLLFGLLPALGVSPSREAAGLKQGGRATRTWGRRTGAGLVMAEVALALVLLAGAGLMVRTLTALYDVNAGFTPRALVSWQVSPIVVGGQPEQRDARRARFFESLLEGVRGTPGVESAALADTPPFRGTMVNTMAVRDSDGERRSVVPVIVTPGYIATMGIPLVAGREFTPDDRASSPRVLIVSATAAVQLWPGQSAIGQRLRFPVKGGLSEPHEVIGVAGDVRHMDLEREVPAHIYQPLAQQTPNAPLVVVARTAQPDMVAAALLGLISSLPERAFARRPQAFNELIAATTLQRRNRATLFAVLAGLGLLLAAVGIVGVTAHAVAQRTREIGIRMALGAQQRNVLRTVMGGLAIPLGAGIALGLLGAWGASRWVESFLFGVERTDPAAYAAAALLLAAAALVASYIPARRALRVDPMVALRAE